MRVRLEALIPGLVLCAAALSCSSSSSDDSETPANTGGTAQPEPCPVTQKTLAEYCHGICPSVPPAAPRQCGSQINGIMSSFSQGVGCGMYVESRCSDDVGTCVTEYYDDASGALLFVRDRRPNGNICFPVIEAGTQVECESIAYSCPPPNTGGMGGMGGVGGTDGAP